MGEDISWPLSVAVHVRDALGLPATKPFFIPPVVPEVIERIPVTGPLIDVAHADEWVLWFSDLLADHLDMPSNAGIEYMWLADRAPAFQAIVESHFDAAWAAANRSRQAYGDYFHRNLRVQGMLITKLVASIEKEIGHRAAPFELDVRVLPVDGFWLHRVSQHRVLLSESARRDKDQLRRLLGPVIRELAKQN